MHFSVVELLLVFSADLGGFVFVDFAVFVGVILFGHFLFERLLLFGHGLAVFLAFFSFDNKTNEAESDCDCVYFFHMSLINFLAPFWRFVCSTLMEAERLQG